MNRRRTFTIAGATAAALVGVLAVTGLPGGGAKADDSDGPRLGTAEVTRRTLVEQQDVDGTLGHGDAVPLVNRTNGTLTWMAEPGSTVDRGEPLYEVDGRKVRLLFGDRPAWRTLGPGMSGVDVKQLKQNLVALGYGTTSGLGTGDAWTAATTDALKRWQKAAGLDQDGIADLGEIVFQPGAVIISSQSGHVGEDARPGGAVLTATPAATVVTVGLDASKRDLIAAGDTVEIELPGGKRIPGTVESVGTSASDGGDGGQGGGGNAEVQVTGAGAAVMGNPLSAVVFLANEMARYGGKLLAGQVILSGSLGPMLAVQPGDSYGCEFGGLGRVGVRFSGRRNDAP